MSHTLPFRHRRPIEGVGLMPPLLSDAPTDVNDTNQILWAWNAHTMPLPVFTALVGAEWNPQRVWTQFKHLDHYRA